MYKVNKSSFYEKVGEKLALARKRQGMTQEDAGEELGVSRVSIVNIEKGRQHISLLQLWCLAKAYHTQLEKLLPNESEFIEDAIGLIDTTILKGKHSQTTVAQFEEFLQKIQK